MNKQSYTDGFTFRFRCARSTVWLAQGRSQLVTMIKYRSRTLRCSYTDPKWIKTMVRMRCFREAFFIASCGAGVAFLLWCAHVWTPVNLEEIGELFSTSAYSAFVWFLATLIVFRTSHSYNRFGERKTSVMTEEDFAEMTHRGHLEGVPFRHSPSFIRFWEGTTLVYKMTGHLTDMTHVALGFTRHGTADQERKDQFKHTFARLVSLLHALILADLEGDEKETVSKALEYDLLDVQSLDTKSLVNIRRVALNREHLPILIFQWLHNLIVDNISTGVLSIPPPLLTRVFRAMTESMLSYHEARKYADTPFPFPYTAGIEIVLTVHFILTPLFVCLWTTSAIAMCVLTFVLLFPMWLLHLVPNELENPFEPDYNGLDTRELQEELNEFLTAILSPPFSHCPALRVLAAEADERLGENQTVNFARPMKDVRSSFSTVFSEQEAS